MTCPITRWASGAASLMRRAQINSASDANGNVASPKFEMFEGTRPAGLNNILPCSAATTGLAQARYVAVSIRYPGIVFAPAKELNGLSLASVGSGTSIEYARGSVQQRGRRVRVLRRLRQHQSTSPAFCDDDDFDTDMGYRGTNQALAWHQADVDGQGSDSRGFETDGDLSQTGYQAATRRR